MDEKSSPYLILIGLWPIAFVILWAVWNLVRDRRDEKSVEKSLNWPETRGTVTTTEVAWAHVDVCYEYSIAGTTYIGKYEISLSPVAPDRTGSGATRLNAEAKQEMAEYPPGAALIIRYNPKNPAESVLYCRDNRSQNKTDNEGSAPSFSTVS